jgi:uncharacterized coiled-coil DUF342 family protein
MKDFKTHEKYLEAIQNRDWQTCDLIAEEHEELVNTIKALQNELNQQKFNNSHNLSIDDEIAEKIKQLQAENRQLRKLIGLRYT